MKLPLADLGTESEKGIVSALDDLFGPSFREVGLYLADKVKFHRLQSLAKILRRARELNFDKSYESEPALKFLIPFMEKASVSDEDELVELWARLLNSEMTESNPHNVFFQGILEQVSRKEVELFEDLILRPTRKRGYLRQLEDVWSFAQRSRIQLIVDRCEPDLEIEDVCESIIGLTEGVGRRIISVVAINSLKDAEMYDLELWPAAISERSGLELIEQLGLIKIVRHDIDSEEYEIKIELAYVTAIGAEFFFATHPKEWSMPLDQRPSGNYPDDGNVSFLDYRAAE